ncbi:6,7-dimethyl-8-ribityllumazine synthase [Rhodomicrobium sp. Az07]|uniref:6,7-dimethyl-8-ribityllumazine synthase n=1 Tax=Rhodomicrobium sp. Az07 TaxID=2839034 RepID=UPI001BEBACA7|nr:6,7-dimethyl-8-ribityllumazine synthase [Rhodomicrobium sp. Az07]MBT3070638.1 6,7-dimethyl-8-ribityllumazine synthase [Rhodomicrobium sp. Az07]
MTKPVHILIIEGRYYSHIADALLEGATRALDEAGATWEVRTVPGALEIPQVLALAKDADLFDEGGDRPFHGCVALGCVIRGETSHYDIVANESAHQLLSLAIGHGIPFGNAILTVENEAQALARADVNRKNKGREAVLACLAVLRLKRAFRRLA